MNTDWSQFWPSMIATFVGFALALFGQWLFEYLSNLSDAINLEKRLRSEISLIKNTLIKITVGGIIDKHPLKTPIWDSALAEGAISKLRDNLRIDFINLYDKIEEINSWFSVDTDYYLMYNQHNQTILQRIKELKNEIENFIIK